MLTGMVVALGYGLAWDDEPQREAVVRSLTGDDEVRAGAASGAASPASIATALIASGTTRIGRVEPVTPALARALTVGDRERLLLAIYRVTLGDRIDAVVRCANARCREAMDVELAAGDLIGPAPTTSARAAADAIHELAVPSGRETWHVRARLPNGSDQEHAATLAVEDARRAADAVLMRTVVGVTAADGRPVPADRWIPALREPLDAAFSRLDPHAEIRVSVACPSCASQTDALFDAAEFLRKALGRTHALLAEIHRLARSYHWSEADILALPIGRRRQYLGLIAADGAPS